MKSPGNKRLFLALILLALGAYVMTIDEAAQLKEREERLQVKFPTGLRAKEEARLVERRRPFLNAPKVTAEDVPKPPVTQDPVLRALGSAQPVRSSWASGRSPNPSTFRVLDGLGQDPAGPEPHARLPDEELVRPPP